MKYTNITLGIGLVVLIGGIIAWGVRDGRESEGVPLSDSDMTLFWGDGCSHCENVKKFLEEKHIADKVSFEEKEVWNDKANAKVMDRRAKSCGLPANQIGVPFLFSDGNCFIGEPDVEKEFLRKASLAEDATQ